MMIISREEYDELRTDASVFKERSRGLRARCAALKAENDELRSQLTRCMLCKKSEEDTLLLKAQLDATEQRATQAEINASKWTFDAARLKMRVENMWTLNKRLIDELNTLRRAYQFAAKQNEDYDRLLIVVEGRLRKAETELTKYQ